MVEVEKLIEALRAYRDQLAGQGQMVKAAVVEHCVRIVQRLAS